MQLAETLLARAHHPIALLMVCLWKNTEPLTCVCQTMILRVPRGLFAPSQPHYFTYLPFCIAIQEMSINALFPFSTFSEHHIANAKLVGFFPSGLCTPQRSPLLNSLSYTAFLIQLPRS